MPVNNAGVMALPTLERTRQGWEMQFATNSRQPLRRVASEHALARRSASSAGSLRGCGCTSLLYGGRPVATSRAGPRDRQYWVPLWCHPVATSWHPTSADSLKRGLLAAHTPVTFRVAPLPQRDVGAPLLIHVTIETVVINLHSDGWDSNPRWSQAAATFRTPFPERSRRSPLACAWTLATRFECRGADLESVSGKAAADGRRPTGGGQVVASA